MGQRAYQNTSKAHKTGRQIHPPLRDKEGNLQLHSPLMVHFILEDHGDNQKRTEVQVTDTLAQTHLQCTVPTSKVVVAYGAAQKSTYRLQPNAEGKAYTVYTLAQYDNLPGTTWHPEPAGTHPSTGDTYAQKVGHNRQEATLWMVLCLQTS